MTTLIKYNIMDIYVEKKKVYGSIQELDETFHQGLP